MMVLKKIAPAAPLEPHSALPIWRLPQNRIECPMRQTTLDLEMVIAFSNPNEIQSEFRTRDFDFAGQSQSSKFG